jgi:uncharacterized membrane protein
MNRAKLPAAALFISTGIAHLSFAADFFERIVPPWVPGSAKSVNRLAGAAELFGGALALVPGAEKQARRYLVALLIAVFPANVQMALQSRRSGEAGHPGRWLLWARLPLQFVAIEWVRRSLRSQPR